MVRRIEYTSASKYGRLSYVGEAGTAPNGQRRVRLRCDCGSEHSGVAGAWVSGAMRSCGCLARELTREKSTTHGHTRVGARTGLYRAWANMRQRCKDVIPAYMGVRHDPRWATFQGFLDFPPGGEYLPGKVLGRYGDLGDYSPENARWITMSQNSREANERRMLRLPDGRFAADVAKANGVKQPTWLMRYRRGIPLEEAVRQ